MHPGFLIPLAYADPRKSNALNLSTRKQHHTRSTFHKMFARGSFGLVVGVLLFSTTWVLATPTSLEKRVDDTIVTFNEIFVPPSTYNTPKTLYGRTVQLADGTLLATWYDVLGDRRLFVPVALLTMRAGKTTLQSRRLSTSPSFEVWIKGKLGLPCPTSLTK